MRYFCERGFEMMVCQSYAKNFGLYNERVGNLITIVKDAETLLCCRSQQELIVRYRKLVFNNRFSYIFVIEQTIQIHLRMELVLFRQS